jgi:hypothetical protein
LPTGGRLCYWLKQQSNSIFASNSEVDVVDFLDRWQWLLEQKLLKKLPMAHHGDEQRRGQELIQRLLHLSIPSPRPTKTRGICSTKPKPVGPEARMFRDILLSWWFDVRRSTTIIVVALAALEDAVRKRWSTIQHE